MAQEIQRKLEETEVKTRELEQRGVEVEKALRGEDEGRCTKDESELLQVSSFFHNFKISFQSLKMNINSKYFIGMV